VMKHRGEKCSLKGRYTLRTPEGASINGAFTASGHFQHGTAYMTYKIDDSQKRVYWYGSLLLNIPEWGNPTGYILCKSITAPGKSALLFVDAVRE
jgi:hypothetical protein